MKILYATRDSYFASDHLKRFMISNKDHEIKIATTIKGSNSIKNVDWILDPIINSVNRRYLKRISDINLPPGDPDLMMDLLSDIKRYKPDIFISDMDNYVSRFIKDIFDIKCILYSPNLLTNSIKWNNKNYEYRYSSSIYDFRCSKSDENMDYYLRIVNSTIPFLDIAELNGNFEYNSPVWVSSIPNNEFNYNVIFPLTDNDRIDEVVKVLKYRDDVALFVYDKSKVDNKLIFDLNDNELYSKVLHNAEWFISDGNNSYLADAFFNDKKISITPSVNDYEALITSCIFEKYNIGCNMGQFELMGRYSFDAFNDSFNNVGSFSFEKKVNICSI